VSRIRKNLQFSIYNFAWGLLKASNLQAELKILKKIIGTPNLSIKTKNFEKKTVFRTLKVERGQKYARTEFAGSTQNPKKKYENIKSTNQNEIFPKKSMFSTYNVYRSQKFVWRLPDGTRSGSLKSNRTQVTFRKP
jgi:hypothetical protein